MQFTEGEVVPGHVSCLILGHICPNDGYTSSLTCYSQVMFRSTSHVQCCQPHHWVRTMVDWPATRPAKLAIVPSSPTINCVVIWREKLTSTYSVFSTRTSSWHTEFQPCNKKCIEIKYRNYWLASFLIVAVTKPVVFWMRL